MLENLRTELASAINSHGQFPLSDKYDPEWVMENQMGPNALWLTEWLVRDMNLRPGMKVLDLGAGRAMSSIFLAKEFDVEVWAVDLWVDEKTAEGVIHEAGFGDKISAIHADAKALPFRNNFFDAAISIDAYEYFGTDSEYTEYWSRFVRDGGELGIVGAGLLKEFEKVPSYLKPYWSSDFDGFHSPGWWQENFDQAASVEVKTADFMRDSGNLWLKWEEIYSRFGNSEGKESLSALDMLKADAGRNLGFVRVIAEKVQ